MEEGVSRGDMHHATSTTVSTIVSHDDVAPAAPGDGGNEVLHIRCRISSAGRGASLTTDSNSRYRHVCVLSTAVGSTWRRSPTPSGRNETPQKFRCCLRARSSMKLFLQPPIPHSRASP